MKFNQAAQESIPDSETYAAVVTDLQEVNYIFSGDHELLCKLVAELGKRIDESKPEDTKH